MNDFTRKWIGFSQVSGICMELFPSAPEGHLFVHEDGLSQGGQAGRTRAGHALAGLPHDAGLAKDRPDLQPYRGRTWASTTPRIWGKVVISGPEARRGLRFSYA